MLGISLGTDHTKILLSLGLPAGGKQRVNKMISKVLASGMSDIQNNDSIELGIKTAPGHFELLPCLNQQVKKGVTVLAGVTDPDEQGKWPATPQGGRGEHVWSTGDPSGRLSVSPCPVINEHQWKTAATQSRRDHEGPRAFRNEGLGHPSRCEPKPAEVLAQGKGITVVVVEVGEGSYKYQL